MKEYWVERELVGKRKKQKTIGKGKEGAAFSCGYFAKEVPWFEWESVFWFQSKLASKAKYKQCRELVHAGE